METEFIDGIMSVGDLHLPYCVMDGGVSAVVELTIHNLDERFDVCGQRTYFIMEVIR